MDFLELHPMPLSPVGREAAVKALAERLRHQTLDEIVAERVDVIYAWQDEEHPVSRRLKRNASRAYTRAELEWAARHDLERLIPKEVNHG